MSLELRTSAGVVLRSIDQSEDKDGFSTSYTFTGTRSECEGQRLLERVKGARQLKVVPLGDGNWELTASYPSDAENGNGDADVPTVTHELDVSMAQQDVFTNSKLVAAMTEAKRHTLKDYVDRYKRGEFESVATALSALDTASGGDATVASYFTLIALKGVDHWIFYRSVYSKMITSATPRQVQASFNGVQKLWTTAQLLAWEQLPSDWWFQLPSGTVWHKSMPKVTTNIGKSRKTQIQYQYIGSDEASTLLYDNY